MNSRKFFNLHIVYFLQFFRNIGAGDEPRYDEPAEPDDNEPEEPEDPP